MFDAIVVPIDDGPDSRRALDTAVLLARAWLAPVQLVTVVSPGVDRGEAERWLADALDDLDAPARAPIVVASNDIAEALRALVGDSALLCMATHARTAIGDLVLGSTARSVVSGATAPLVLVGPRCAPKGGFDSIVVPIRPGSGFSARAASVATAWATDLGARIELVGAVSAEERMLVGDDEAGAELEALAAAARHEGVDASWHIVPGDDIADRVLEVAADRSSSLLVVATHARRPIARLALGSVAQAITRKATCPVLVVPPGVARPS